MIIGWQEWVSLPDFQIPAIHAKIDTGADTSSLHADQIKRFRKAGQRWVSFEIHPLPEHPDIVLFCRAPLMHRRVVKSSSGDREIRPVILTQLRLGDRQFEIELNLTNRDYMGCRMLLGRQALQQDILIDPSKAYLQGSFTEMQIVEQYLKKG